MVTCKRVIDLIWSARWSPRGLGGVLKGGIDAVIGACRRDGCACRRTGILLAVTCIIP